MDFVQKNVLSMIEETQNGLQALVTNRRASLNGR